MIGWKNRWLPRGWCELRDVSPFEVLPAVVMWVERAQTLNVRLCACVYARVCVYVDLPCPSTAVFLSPLMQRTGALKMLVFLLWNLNVYQTLDTRGHIRTQLCTRVNVSPCSKIFTVCETLTSLTKHFGERTGSRKWDKKVCFLSVGQIRGWSKYVMIDVCFGLE